MGLESYAKPCERVNGYGPRIRLRQWVGGLGQSLSLSRKAVGPVCLLQFPKHLWKHLRTTNVSNVALWRCDAARGIGTAKIQHNYGRRNQFHNNPNQ